jgi:hypothetical protein
MKKLETGRSPTYILVLSDAMVSSQHTIIKKANNFDIRILYCQICIDSIAATQNARKAKDS